MASPTTPSAGWLQPRRRGSVAKPILCFPASGCTASTFAAWIAPARPDLDIVGVQLPGRGVRLREPAIDSIEDLLSSMGSAVGPTLPEDYYILGYCLGGIIGYEFTRWLEHTSFPPPAKLFICGCGAPDTELDEDLADPSDAQLVRQLRRWGGMTDEALANADILKLALPPLRADLRLLARYRYTAAPRTKVPIVTLRGVDDPTLSVDAVRRWEHCTSGPVQHRKLAGAHFLPPGLVLEAVRAELEPSSSATTRTT